MKKQLLRHLKSIRDREAKALFLKRLWHARFEMLISEQKYFIFRDWAHSQVYQIEHPRSDYTTVVR